MPYHLARLHPIDKQWSRRECDGAREDLVVELRRVVVVHVVHVVLRAGIAIVVTFLWLGYGSRAS